WDAHGRRQAPVERVGPPLHRGPAAGAGGDHLPGGVDAGVGASSTEHPHLFSRQRGDRVLQHPLDGGPAGLALESQEIRAVIGYDTADGSHRNRHPTTAKSVSDPTSTAPSAAP